MGGLYFAFKSVIFRIFASASVGNPKRLASWCDVGVGVGGPMVGTLHNRVDLTEKLIFVFRIRFHSGNANHSRASGMFFKYLSNGCCLFVFLLAHSPITGESEMQHTSNTTPPIRLDVEVKSAEWKCCSTARDRNQQHEELEITGMKGFFRWFCGWLLYMITGMCVGNIVVELISGGSLLTWNTLWQNYLNVVSITLNIISILVWPK